MPGRSGNSSEYRYGFNQGSEKDDEITGVTGSHITTHFREFDLRLNRTWSVDPVVQPWQSPYSSMDNNPIWFNDPLGDKVKYKKVGDRIKVGISRLFSKKFNSDFKTKRDDELNTFTYQRSEGASRLKSAKAELNLLDAPVDGRGTLANQYDVKYDNWALGNFDDTRASSAMKAPFKIGWSIGKLGLGSITGLGIGFHNIFAKNKIGWGMGDRLSFHTKANLLSWGVGNYNKYNMFGGRQKGPKIDPTRAPGLIGLRVGVGKKRPVNFIDVLGEVYNKKGQGLHLHLNAAGKKTRRRKLMGAGVVNLKD